MLGYLPLLPVRFLSPGPGGDGLVGGGTGPTLLPAGWGTLQLLSTSGAIKNVAIHQSSNGSVGAGAVPKGPSPVAETKIVQCWYEV